jgi:hypothetical protein|tara:strand:- start:2859 stop:2978 length:120 start_codon:yes stop_codon:yes gene_type:complete
MSVPPSGYDPTKALVILSVIIFLGVFWGAVFYTLKRVFG